MTTLYYLIIVDHIIEEGIFIDFILNWYSVALFIHCLLPSELIQMGKIRFNDQIKPTTYKLQYILY